ncbi:alpha/beta hydrolase-fold protein [Burkholderia lata]|uniref:Esterase n=1 Tax=Burkholderia lata (strain ATCC 17760 / DSM 23089 / LMG 22485 / NCIMB 9086 / R18194 / 383) TaxID=482957 RepID=A0A6P2RYK9_BURL3|nr:alpha/beta hydrolase-fold protein [Burkholderia lata]VWC42141.1 esterase [Burkholderia lata]
MMTLRNRATRIACTWRVGVALAAIGMSTAHAEGTFATGEVVTGNVAREPTAHALALDAGTFVQGRLEGAAATVDLATGDGRHLRRLVTADGQSRDFMFVAPADGGYVLQVSAPEAGAPSSDGRRAYRLAIVNRVPCAQQRAPVPGIASPRVATLAAELAAGGSTDAFWREVAASGTPLVEPVPAQPARIDATIARGLNPPDEATRLVTFLWRGARDNVRLLGSPSGEHDTLRHLPGSDVWYRSYVVPATTRISYLLAPDVPELDLDDGARRRAILATAQRDPLNPHAFMNPAPDPFQGKSVLELRDAPPQPWIAARANVPAGSLTAYRFVSTVLGNTRDVYLYRPAGYRADDPARALVVVFDAHAYVDAVPTPTILDNLIAEGRVPRTAALIVGNPDGATRGRELPPNPAFARFLAEELMPWARREGVSAPAARTVIAGSSYGGLASAYAALRHPELFGNVLSQSGSFWWAPTQGDARTRTAEWLTREYGERERLPVRFYLESGRFEDGKGPAGIGTTSRHLRDVLQAKGYAVRYASTASGHDYLHWRGSLACGLVALIGTPGQGERAPFAAACPFEQPVEPSEGSGATVEAS